MRAVIDIFTTTVFTFLRNVILRGDFFKITCRAHMDLLRKMRLFGNVNRNMAAKPITASLAPRD